MGYRLAAAVVCALTLVPVSGSAAQTDRLAAYAGTGTWVSIYDHKAWQNPEQVIARLQTRHIHTLYLQTSNARQSAAIRYPDGVSRFLDAAHRARIRVVGWYLPSFTNNRRDLARSVSGARFTTSTRQRFDAF